MNTETSRPRLPRTAALGSGRGGQPRLLVDAPAGGAEIYLHGAHLTAWTPRGGRPVLFTSRQARFDGETAIRGGVPVCLPWFGAGPDGTARPKHGWARLMTWSLRSVEATPDDGVRALLSLDNDGLAVLYEITVGESLSTTLSVRNTGPAPRRVEAALHAYLSVHDVTACVLTGLEGAEYSEGDAVGLHDDAPLRIAGPVDRIYRSRAAVRVTDPGNHRALVVSGRQSPTTVVWNPWARDAAGMADMADDEFASFVCVETAAAREDAPLLEPGGSWSMGSVVTVEPL